tara:strand:- start:1661 stop:2557 length:897 start_codon:yes stop_codon:yes gene_type:complete
MKNFVIYILISKILFSQSAFQSIELIYDSKSLGISGVGISNINSDESEFQNPSLLANNDKKLKLSFIQYPANINSHYFKYTTKFKNLSLSGNYKGINFGNFERYDNDGIHFGQFSARDNLFGMSIANSLTENSALGFSLSLFQSRIDDLNSILGLITIGGNINFPTENFSLGGVIRNIGLIFDHFTTYEEMIPSSAGLGISKKLEYLPLTIYSDIIWWKSRTIFKIGGEFVINKNFQLQFGTSSEKNNFNTDLLWRDIFSGFSSGFLYNTGRHSIDMSLLNNGIAGILIGIGISSKLN